VALPSPKGAPPLLISMLKLIEFGS
jgi:hypothetical protein